LKNIKDNLEIKLRIQIGEFAQFGPGKVYLMEAIEKTGSISAAAKKIGMSYRKAWKLINDLNRISKSKMVVTSIGGRGSGGAKLTNTGKEFIDLFRKMEVKALIAIKNEKIELEKILNDLK
tara:strand:- start:1687 stop:2049 length:363 start_codon:yes stop_codon:yes gene_type:complete